MTLIVIGMLMVAALMVAPPEGLFATWGLWALACALQLAGVALMVLPPVIHLWITQDEIILHPSGPRRHIPVQHIHDMELTGPEQARILTLHLRNGEDLNLSDWTKDTEDVAALLDQLGVPRRDSTPGPV